MGVRRAAHPRDVHVVAVAHVTDAVASEGSRLHQARRIGAVVPAPEPPSAQRGRLLDRDPARILECRRGEGTKHGRGLLVGDPERELDALPGLPEVSLHVWRLGDTAAVVAKRLLAIGKVEPDHWPALAEREADTGLPDRA